MHEDLFEIEVFLYLNSYPRVRLNAPCVAYVYATDSLDAEEKARKYANYIIHSVKGRNQVHRPTFCEPVEVRADLCDTPPDNLSDFYNRGCSVRFALN